MHNGRMAAATIALFLRSPTNDYQDLLREDCLMAASRHGLGARVFFADNDAERQLRQIREVLGAHKDLRPSAILVAPIREATLLGVAYDAARLGIGWVTLNRWFAYTVELRNEFPHLPLFCVN